MGCVCDKYEMEPKQHPSTPAISGEDYNPKVSQIKSKETIHYRDTHQEFNEAEQIILNEEVDQGRKIKLEEFQIIKLLGKGSFGKVLLVERKRQYYAMKILKKLDIQRKNQKLHTQYERLILAKSNNNFVVKLYWAFQTKQKLYFIMDFQQGGELFFHLRRQSRFTEVKTKFYAAELLLALEHLHNEKIIYRDLKPENILIGRDGHIKITDFGLSKYGVNMEDKTYSFVGTPEYLAPEILIGQGHNFVCDFWSLGALIYEMLSGSPPFYSRDKSMMFRNRLEKPIDMKPYFSEGASLLLQGLLCNDPRFRLGSSGHQEIKDHVFFKDIDWVALSKLQVQPPFIPNVYAPDDLNYFDPVFTQENPNDSKISSNAPTMDKYPQFTYERQISVDDVYQSVQEMN